MSINDSSNRNRDGKRTLACYHGDISRENAEVALDSSIDWIVDQIREEGRQCSLELEPVSTSFMVGGGFPVMLRIKVGPASRDYVDYKCELAVEIFSVGPTIPACIAVGLRRHFLADVIADSHMVYVSILN